MKKVIIGLILFLPLMTWGQNSTQKGNDVIKRRVEFIKDFIGTYQKAYEEMKIKYIESFFSTDALIITETKELSRCGTETAPHSTKKRPYKLVVEDKREYLDHLNKLFKDKRKIKLNIAKMQIKKHSLYPDIYGISFTQMWLDEKEGNNLESQMPGYIFLMVDFRKHEMRPIIHVRTWQPKENVRSEQDKFNLYDFVIYDF